MLFNSICCELFFSPHILFLYLSITYPVFYFPFLNNCYCHFSFDLRAFRWVQTMVFAIEEINNNPRLLPGVKLGYRILDSCDHVHTSLQSAFSLVNGSSLPQRLPCLFKDPVPAIIGLASSTPTRAVAHTFGPFNIPMVSFVLKDANSEGKKSNTVMLYLFTLMSL